MNFLRRQWIGLTLAAVGLLSCGIRYAYAQAPSGSGVRVFETNDVVRVEIDGSLFTEYRFRDVSRPFLYPILGPNGSHFTRRWPQEEVAGEERDHPHHHALWWSHGEVNGVDLWSESTNSGRTLHQYFVEKKSGKDVGILSTRNEWRGKDGKLVGMDERTFRFHRSPADARIVDFEITIFANPGELTFGDTKEGTLAIRLAESMRVMQPKGVKGEGHIVNSRDDRDGEAWGKRAEWCDYHGPVDGKTLGVAIFDHPSNPRYPTWWHVRDYGLFAANPFGVHDFEKKPKGEGDLKIPAGQHIKFRYRLYFHAGDTSAAKVAEHYKEWSEIAEKK